MPLTPDQDAQLAKVQLAHTDPEALAAPRDGAIEGKAVRRAAPREQEEAEDRSSWRGEVTLRKEVFRVADEIGAMPLLIWASVAEMTTADNRAMAAIYSMLKDCVHAEHWARFQMHAIDTKAKTEELLDVVTTALELLAANPTGSSSPASGGSQRTSGGSRASSSSRRARKSST